MSVSIKEKRVPGASYVGYPTLLRLKIVVVLVVNFNFFFFVVAFLFFFSCCFTLIFFLTLDELVAVVLIRKYIFSAAFTKKSLQRGD